MQLTSHATRRIEERGLAPERVWLTVRYGKRLLYPGRKSVKYRMRFDDELYFVVQSLVDQNIITVAKRKIKEKRR